MTTTSPWAGPATVTPAPPVPAPAPTVVPPGPYPHAPGGGPRKPRRWPKIVAAAAAVLGLMAITATVTHQITQANDRSPATPSEGAAVESAAPSPTVTGDASAAADRHLCDTFQATTAGSKGQGGVVTNGDLNEPVVIRILGSVIAVQAATTAEVSGDVASAAATYTDSSLRLANAALADEPIEQLVALTEAGNAATDALATACGIR